MGQAPTRVATEKFPFCNKTSRFGDGASQFEAKSAPLFQAAAAIKRSSFFVGFDVAVDQIGDIIVIFLFFFEEGVVTGVIAKIYIIVHDRCDLLVPGVGVFERNDFSSRFRQFSFFILGHSGPRSGSRRGRRLEGRPAFGAENRISVQIEKLCAAILALELAAEFRFGQFCKSPVVVRGNGQDGQCYRTVGLFARRVAVNPLSGLIARIASLATLRASWRQNAFQRSSSESQ